MRVKKYFFSDIIILDFEWIKMTDTSDRSILAGENLSLECQAKAFPAAKVTWYFEGEPIKSSPRILVTENQLRIFQTEEEDSGKYSCGYSYEKIEKSTPPVRIEVRSNGFKKSKSSNKNLKITLPLLILFL